MDVDNLYVVYAVFFVIIQVRFDKITIRIETLVTKEPKLNVDFVVIAQKVVSGLYSGVTTCELDNLAAEIAAYMSTQHPGIILNW